jgi:hypothetical protein
MRLKSEKTVVEYPCCCLRLAAPRSSNPATPRQKSRYTASLYEACITILIDLTESRV